MIQISFLFFKSGTINFVHSENYNLQNIPYQKPPLNKKTVGSPKQNLSFWAGTNWQVLHVNFRKWILGHHSFLQIPPA